MARPVPAAAVRPERRDGPHRHYRERPSDCHVFLTASKANGLEGRPFGARTTDGGLTWHFLSFIGPEPTGYAIMPSTVRLSPTDLVTTIRRRQAQELDRCLCLARQRPDVALPVDAEPDTGEGNPPSLLRLADGRLCLIYGYVVGPYQHPGPLEQ